MNAAELREGKRYIYRDKVLTYAGHTGRTWYFEWGRFIVCLWAAELNKLQSYDIQ